MNVTIIHMICAQHLFIILIMLTKLFIIILPCISKGINCDLTKKC